MSAIYKLKKYLSTFYDLMLKSKAGKSGIIYTATNFFNAALPFFLLPILTTKLNESQYGLVSMILVVVSILTPLMTLGVTGAISRAYFKKEITDFPRYIGNSLLIVFGGFIIICVLFTFGGSFLSQYTAIPPSWLFACIFIALETFIIELKLVTFRLKFEAKKYSFIKISQTILSFIITYVFVVTLDLNWRGAIMARLIVITLFSLLSLIQLYKDKEIKFSYNKKYMYSALLFGVPLLPHLLSSFIINASDRIFITNILDLSKTGNYSVGYQIGSVIDLVSSSFNLAWSPWLFSKLTDFDKNFSTIKKATSIGLTFLIVLTFFFLLLTPLLLRTFVSNSFDISIPVICTVAIGFVFQGFYLFFVNYLFYEGRTKLISMVTIAIAVLNLILNYIMIIQFGVLGAAIATAICFFLKFLIIFLITNNQFKLYFYD